MAPGGWGDVDQCTYTIESAVTHGEWETEPGHPDPGEVMADIKADCEASE